MTRSQNLNFLIVFGCLTWAVSARADAVVDWNAIAVQAITTAVPPHPGATGFLDIATVQAAVYDAVESIDGRFRPYHRRVPGASGSMAAAVAKAAHDVLLNRFPGQAAFLDTAYHDYLFNNGLADNDPGVSVGQQAAADIIAFRANDGSFPNPPPPDFVGGTDPGVWRPTPPSMAPMLVTWLATVTPFTAISPSQFRPGPPPALTSCRYARDYNEVKALGGLVNSARTPEQTDLAYFFSDNYLVLWNRGVRDIAVAYLTNIGDTARLFALVSMAMADAGISCWDTKRHYVFWRPITAIQEGDNDGNPRTIGDPTWQPLTDTPPYPDYTSGANAVNSAAAHILRFFFGTDHLTFSLNSGNPNVIQKTRTYCRLSEELRDVVNARIYEGIHFRFADLAGRKQGRQVARWAFKNFLRPVCENTNDANEQDGDDE
jgi:hypothetical protein